MPKKTPRHLLAAASNARAARKAESHSRAASSLLGGNGDRGISSLGDSEPGIQQTHGVPIWDETDDESECGYEGGVDNFISDAQKHVCAFSSRVYKSHRRVPEQVATQFD